MKLNALKLFLFAILWLFLSNKLEAQKSNKNKWLTRTNAEAGVTLSSNGELSAAAFSYVQYLGFGKKKNKFKLGFGARLTSSLGGKKVIYQTAPAILTSGKTGPAVFFAEQVTQNIDSLTLNNTQVNALNLLIALHFDFSSKWGAEFNIDMFGFSLGGTKDANLSYGDGLKGERITSAKPTFGNALLISDNDLGSLNSELMVFYKWKPRLKFKAGFSFLFNEYTIDNPVLYTNSIGTVVDTDRYRTKVFGLALGVNYIFKRR